MRGHSLTPDDGRPRLVGSDGASPAEPPRFFCCARCRGQAFICSQCDRGQIYCAEGCASEARRAKQGEAGQRYQRSLRGRRNHAARMARYRARQNKVTHQGSPAPAPDAVVILDLATAQDGEPSPPTAVADERPARIRCHWCASGCPDWVRRDFLRRRPVRPRERPERGGRKR